MAETAPQTKPRKHFSTKIISALILGCTTLVFAFGSLIGKADADSLFWQALLRRHDKIMLALGTDKLGSVYVTKNRLLAHFPDPDEAAVAAAAAAVNRYAEAQSVPVYMLAVPTSSAIYSEALPDSAPLANEQMLLRRFSEGLNDTIIWIEAASWLTSEKEQYIYYRTDPCWTAYGAFCVYRSAIRKLGFSAVGYDRFSITHCTADYYGRLAQQAHYFSMQPDIIDLYYNNSTLHQPERAEAIRPDGNVSLPAYYRTDLPDIKTNPELVFAIESEPILRLETDNPGTRDLLLLTDSFGDSMIPLLMQHYRSITAVSLTLTDNLDWQTLTQGDYAQILILCGTDTVAAPNGLSEKLAGPAA